MEPPAQRGKPEDALPEDGNGERPPPFEQSDTDLIAISLSAASGDSRAFDELVRRHQGHIRANCRFIVEDPEDALDLAQEAFVKAYFGLASFSGRSSFRTWLRRIKVNQCLSFLKSPRSRTNLSLGELQPGGDAALQVQPTGPDLVESAETRNRISLTLDGIPASLRIPLVLRDMDGFSYQEIQEMLDIGPSALKMRISRGREAFRQAWAKDQGGTE